MNELFVTNKDDSLKVLATTASTVYIFTEKNPNAYILATGSKNIWTRLYRMRLTNIFAEITEDFLIVDLQKKEIGKNLRLVRIMKPF